MRGSSDTQVKTLFNKIDDDGNGEITRDEANKFWKKNFAKVRAYIGLGLPIRRAQTCSALMLAPCHGLPCR